jgi:hypothetical protein
MRRSLATLLLLAMCVASRKSHAQATDAPLTVAEYIHALDASLGAVRSVRGDRQKATDIVHNLPSAWRVEAGGRTLEVSTESIRRDLGAFQAKPDSASLDTVLQRLETLRYQAAAYENPEADFTSQRSRLNDILSRKEFRSVHGQTWIDRLKQKLTAFLIRILQRAFASSAIPAISDIVVYGLIVIAVLALAYWMYRSLR